MPGCIRVGHFSKASWTHAHFTSNIISNIYFVLFSTKCGVKYLQRTCLYVLDYPQTQDYKVNACFHTRKLVKK